MNVLEYIPRTRSRARVDRARQQAKFKASSPKPAPKAFIPQDPFPLPGKLKSRLNALRARHRLFSVLIGLSMIVGATSILFLVQGASDWWLDIPWIARAAFLIADISFLTWIYRRWLDRPLRKRLTLAEASLLVEKKWPDLRQCIITTVELAEGRPTVARGSRQLLDILLQQTLSRTNHLKFSEVIPAKPLRRWLILGGVAFLGTIAIAASALPNSLILLERIFLLNVPLPTKTIVVPITRDLIVPLGSNVELSAQATGVYIPTHGRVTISYSAGTSQDFPVKAQPNKDNPDLNDTFVLTVSNVQKPFKYTFYLYDGHSAQFTVTTAVPPSTANLTCHQIFPPYTLLAERDLKPTDLSLLAGSHLTIEADSTDPLQSATIILQGVQGPGQSVAATLKSKTRLVADIAIPAKDLTGFSIHLAGESGLSSSNETVYPIVIIPDNPPVLKFLEPQDERETITLRTKPTLIFEAGDDFGLTQLSINYQLLPPVTEQGADAPEEVKPISDVIQIPIPLNPVKDGKQSKHYEYTLDVATPTPGWKEGYSVNYWIEAVDNNDVTGPGKSKSESKQFGIVSLEEKLKEILEREKAATDLINKAAGTEDNISSDVKEGIPANTPPAPDTQTPPTTQVPPK